VPRESQSVAFSRSDGKHWVTLKPPAAPSDTRPLSCFVDTFPGLSHRLLENGKKALTIKSEE
jgi:hypothetical protein